MPRRTQYHHQQDAPKPPGAAEGPLRQLLALLVFPGTLTTEQVAQRIGCHVDDIPGLQGLVLPLGDPGEKAVKRYLTKEVLEFLEDRDRMDRFWSAVYRRNRKRNAALALPGKRRARRTLLENRVHLPEHPPSGYGLDDDGG